jgi:hydrogenase expression/formation protein HypC
LNFTFDGHPYMCLALPARVVSLPEGGTDAVVDLGGVRKTISIALVPEARVGDYVIVHVGHAIGAIDPEEAERTLALFGELAALEAEGGAEGAAGARA